SKFEPYKIEYAGTIQSEPFDITLPQPKQDSIHCLILNDIHEDKDSHAYLFDKSKLAKKDLVFLNGDSFHYVSNQADLTEKLLKPVGNKFASTTPFLMIRGNHETRGSFARDRSEEHTSELQSRENLVCRLLLDKKIATHIVHKTQ